MNNFSSDDQEQASSASKKQSKGVYKEVVGERIDWRQGQQRLIFCWLVAIVLPGHILA